MCAPTVKATANRNRQRLIEGRNSRNAFSHIRAIRIGRLPGIGLDQAWRPRLGIGYTPPQSDHTAEICDAGIGKKAPLDLDRECLPLCCGEYCRNRRRVSQKFHADQSFQTAYCVDHKPKQNRSFSRCCRTWAIRRGGTTGAVSADCGQTEDLNSSIEGFRRRR